jgi:polysaccharide export outer membrane protein
MKVATACTLPLLVAAWLSAEQTPVAPGYVLGPEDELMIRIPGVDEISENPFRIDASGYINLPMAGRVSAAGRTVEQLEADLVERLRRYLRNPEISIIVKDYRSQPVMVLGAVSSPGVQQLRGRRSLFEVISTAGGLKPEAGNTVKITRNRRWGAIPLATAKDDATGQFSVAEVNVRSIMEASSPEENIQILPDDVISVPRAQVVYVIGAVRRPGGFPLYERETISVLQALALAEGLDRLAAAKSARILRTSPLSTTRTEIAIDVKKVLAGKSKDVPLEPDDILFVPHSAAKSATLRSLEAVIQLGTGVMIYRR